MHRGFPSLCCARLSSRRRFADGNKRLTRHAPHCLCRPSSRTSFYRQSRCAAHRRPHSPKLPFPKAPPVLSDQEPALFPSVSRDKVFAPQQNPNSFAASRSMNAPSETPPSVPACHTEIPRRSDSISSTEGNLVLASLADRLLFGIPPSTSSEPPLFRLFRITFSYFFQSITSVQ